MEQARAVAAPVPETPGRAEPATIKADLRRLASELRRAPRNPVVRDLIPRPADALRG
ncbi:hypothetical protein Ate01nite_33700 [Actinoplanes teichomyceticus]|nr:hypothetical protein Ate01nite_33700 [Actinoplanes teichomyceticus]